jgi:hypothetical protein
MLLLCQPSDGTRPVNPAWYPLSTRQSGTRSLRNYRPRVREITIKIILCTILKIISPLSFLTLLEEFSRSRFSVSAEIL